MYSLETIFKFSWRESKRTFAEQIIGFLLFLSTIFTLTSINSWIIKKSINTNWYIQASLQNLIWTATAFFISLSFWMLWRRVSFRDLKLEGAFLFTNLILVIMWHTLFFLLKESFLGLIVSLILLGNTLLCFCIFWKKDKLAGLFFLIYLFWVGTITTCNMLVCI